MSKIQYCSHSRQGMFFQQILLKENKFNGFNRKFYDSIIDEIRASGNGVLVNEIPDEKLMSEANDIYDRIAAQ